MILIKNMDMPESCEKCNLSVYPDNDDWLDGDPNDADISGYACGIKEKHFDHNWQMERPDWCPLVERKYSRKDCALCDLCKICKGE